jgi:hypothetical protein
MRNQWQRAVIVAMALITPADGHGIRRKRSGMRTVTLFLASVIVMSAQVNSSSISGTILDPSGAGVPSATVTLLNEQTGVRLTAKSTEAGNYLFAPLQEGKYTIQVETAGFKKTERPGLDLQIGDKLGVNVTLEIGNVQETVEVKAESPLLTTTNASIGHVITNDKIMELPLPGRSPVRLFQLAPEVGGTSGGMADLRLGGGRIRQVDFYVDGSPTTNVSDGSATAIPAIDSIAEVKIETNNLSAEYGRTSGGAISIQTKAGTNQFHGSLYDFEQNDILNANDWNSNRRGNPKAGFNKHQFGGTLGGPVWIPHLYNGKNRTFFFFNYDGERTWQNGALQTATMPTDLERNGDFSQTLNNAGQKVTIYDPYTYNAASNARQPFPGNIIPTSRFDPVAKYLLTLWPEPNRPGDPGNGANNFYGQSSSFFKRNDVVARVDQNFGNNHRVYVRITDQNNYTNPSDWAGPATSGVRPSWITQRGSTANWTWTARPTMIVSAQFGFAPWDSTYYPVFSGFDPTQVPFAPNARAQLDPRFIPYESFEKVAGLGVSYQTTLLHTRNGIGTLSLMKVWNRHTLKVGYEERLSYLNDQEANFPSGGASFSGDWTGLNQQAPLAQQGSGFASFLLGTPDSFSFDAERNGWAVSFRNYAAYAQDDFKVSPRLTLNLGLRWEYEAPETERYNRLEFMSPTIDNGFHVTPGYNFQSQVINAGLLPAGSPIPNLSGPFLGGGGVVDSSLRSGRSNMDPYWKNFGPRVGVAYQIDSKTVFRSGFAILYSGYTGNASGTGSVSMYSYINSTGTASITRDNGQTVAATLSNPFPGNYGLLASTNDPQEVMNRLMGGGILAYQTDHRPSYEISYNGGFQHTLAGKWLLEGSFTGNNGVHLYVGGNPYINTLNPQYLSLGALLNKTVPNPFYGTLAANNTTPLSQPTIAYKYLLNPMPQYPNGVRSLQASWGNSHYLAGMFKVERRFSNGFSLLVSYTVSKLIEDTAAKAGTSFALPQDGHTYSDVRGLSVQDIPQKLVLTYLYELPIGKGKKLLTSPQGFGEKLLEKAIGGWQIAGFSIFQSGYPLQITQSDNFTSGLGYGTLRPTLVNNNYGTGVDISQAVGYPASARYLNPAAFAVTSVYAFGTVPSVLPNMRQPRYDQTDLAIIKKFHFTESKFLEARVEGSNMFNHPVFMLDSNALNIQNSTFGYLQALQNSPRNIQLGARFVF